MDNFISDKVNDAYVETDSKTFVCSDLLRNQIEGLLEFLEKDQLGKLGFTRKDFSQTGAARTMALDVTKFFRQGVLSGLMEIPDIYQSMFDR